MTATKNMADSVRARLLNQARKEQRPFQELMQYFAIERFLFRLAASRYREQFILKGIESFRKNLE